MMPKVLAASTFVPSTPGKVSTIPRGVGISASSGLNDSPSPLEHPQPMSTTVQSGFPPRNPRNDSSLAIAFPPESPPVPAEDR